MSYEFPGPYDDRPVPEVVSVLDGPAAQLLVVRLLVTRGISERTIAKVVADLDMFDPATLTDFPDEFFESRYGMQTETIAHFRAAEDQARQLLHELGRDEVAILIAGSRDYPSQLAATLALGAPPVLFALGDLTLLTAPGVGFCGSREASARALAAVSRCAHQLAIQNVNVISGYAKGVDLAAHQAAIEAGGSTTIVLAEGISRFRRKRELDEAGNSQLLVLSQFSPRSTWSVGNAMARNWTICSLADAMVVVESQIGGGTFAAGEAALQLKRPLYVIDYGGRSAPGNVYFIAKGAKPLRRTREGTPAAGQLLADARRQAARDEYRARSTGTHLSDYVDSSERPRPAAHPKLFRV